MIHPKPINYERIRKIKGSFAWVPHAFVRQGFWSNLSHHGVLLYLFLMLASDRNGISYYSFDRICSMLKINTDEYIQARNALIDQSLIAFDGYSFQVLSLPYTVIKTLPQPSCSPKNMRKKNPRNIYIFAASYQKKKKPGKLDQTNIISEAYKKAVMVMMEQIKVAQNQEWEDTSRDAALMWNQVMRERILSPSFSPSGGENGQ